MGLPDPEKPRRQFQLPPEDTVFLNGLGKAWEAVVVANQNWVLVYEESISPGYNVAEADVAIMIAPGYPPGMLDMAYFNPALVLANGALPRNIQCSAKIDDKTWQGWSRHRTPDNPWLPGEDNLESHYFYMRAWLVDELKR